MRTYEKKGYVPVSCDEPLPCPFCGSEPELAQLAHNERFERVSRGGRLEKVKTCILCSAATLTADTFWFLCPICGATSGKHCTTAQEAAENWNTRTRETEANNG
jgi:predicted RNA-binding Zn-ribbon protein involved in translation (DUF1610 family)